MDTARRIAAIDDQQAPGGAGHRDDPARCPVITARWPAPERPRPTREPLDVGGPPSRCGDTDPMDPGAVLWLARGGARPDHRGQAPRARFPPPPPRRLRRGRDRARHPRARPGPAHLEPGTGDRRRPAGRARLRRRLPVGRARDPPGAALPPAAGRRRRPYRPAPARGDRREVRLPDHLAGPHRVRPGSSGAPRRKPSRPWTPSPTGVGSTRTTSADSPRPIRGHGGRSRSGRSSR